MEMIWFLLLTCKPAWKNFMLVSFSLNHLCLNLSLNELSFPFIPSKNSPLLLFSFAPFLPYHLLFNCIILVNTNIIIICWVTARRIITLNTSNLTNKKDIAFLLKNLKTTSLRVLIFIKSLAHVIITLNTSNFTSEKRHCTFTQKLKTMSVRVLVFIKYSWRSRDF